MMKHAHIKVIEYYLPEATLTNQQLAEEFPEWSIDKIEKKTGIFKRHIAASGEYVSDMTIAAAEKLFEKNICDKSDIDYLLLCTQCPDHLLPTTACIVQHKLNLPKSVGALDINLGCSGFVYGLSLAKGLIQSNQAKNILLITADTYTKFINPKDKTVRTLFGDGAAATLISATDESGIEDFVFGTDGEGAKNLIVPLSGMKGRNQQCSEVGEEPRTLNDLYMNGPEIFSFTLEVVPKTFHELLTKANCHIDEISCFIFHQANEYMLTNLRDKLAIPEDKFFISLKNQGNTVSSTIPIALNQALKQGKIQRGDRIMLLGFGVGYSWAGAMLRWH